MRFEDAGFSLPSDASSAAWLEGVLAPADECGLQVAGIVPRAFEAHARILHPAHESIPDATEDTLRPVTWREIARRNGAALRAESTFREITVGPGVPIPPGSAGAWENLPRYLPQDGYLADEQLRATAKLLAGWTSTPARCWIGVWRGWGGTAFSDPTVPGFRGPGGESFALLVGPLDRVGVLRSNDRWVGPSVWWPDDRRWCIGTEIDAYSTYVAGDTACIDAVLDSPLLEVVRADPDALAIRRGEWLD